MIRSRKISVLFALGVFAVASLGFGQSFSKRKPGLFQPPRGAAPQGVCGPTTLSESTNDIVDANSVHCPVGDNSYWRAFTLTDFGINNDFNVCDVEVGIETAISGLGNGQPVTVNLYTSDQAFPAGYPGSLTLIGTANATVLDQSLTIITIPVTGTAPGGSQLAVEFATFAGADGDQLFIGSNTAAETAPSYILAASCGATVPTPTDGLLPGLIMHIVMTVRGTEAPDTVTPTTLAVDAPPPAIQVSGNGVLELNETATVTPGWTNVTLADLTMTGAMQNFTGPCALCTLTINPPATADYGTITAGSTKTCIDPCYSLNATGDRSAQPTHLDLSVDELVTPAAIALKNATTEKTWVLHVGESFSDVTPDGPDAAYYPSIENIFHHGITGGCLGGTQYCPQAPNLRSEMAVFLGKASNPPGYVPPDCAGIFSDVPCPATPEFPYSNWIEAIYPNITAGCSSDPGPPPTIQYCPDQAIPRSQMAVFLDKASHAPGYAPPDCLGVFTDVPCPATPEFPYSNFIEDIYNQGITAGCSSDPGPPPTIQYCPDQPVTREQMAVFITLTFKLALYGP